MTCSSTCKVFAAAVVCLSASFATAAEPTTRPSGGPAYVAVGYGGRRMSSPDGVHWENVQQWAEDGRDDSNNLMSIAYGKGKSVAVGGGGWSKETQAGHILISTDGKEWREVKKMAFRIHPILFAPDVGGGRFVAGGPDHTLWWSDDGETWNEGAKIDPKIDPSWAFWFRSGAVGNGVFLFRGNAGKGQKTQWLVATPDGQRLTTVATDLPEGCSGPAFGAGTFVMVAPGGACLTSRDGAKWETATLPEAEGLEYVLWTGRHFYAAGKKAALTSPDGVSWAKLADRTPCHVLFADESRHLFIGTSWPGQMWSSTDGIDWKKSEPLPKDGINCIASNGKAAGNESK